jgi:DNA-binding response OmpR family regulator
MAPDVDCKISGIRAIRGVLRSYRDPVFEVQDVRLDPESRRTWRAGREIRLSRKEFDLLEALISRAGSVVSRDELMREVWNATFWTSSKTIDVHLGWVRKKLGDDTRNPSLITTVRGQGLRFETQTARENGTPIEA